MLWGLRFAIKKFRKFFDIRCLVHHDFVQPGQSVTGQFYVQILQRLSDAVGRTARQVAGTVVSASQ
jgi:hypothetical protein